MMKINFLLVSLFLFFNGNIGIPELITSVGNPQTNQQSYQNLTAVLIVGPQQDETPKAIEKMEAIHAFFKEKGIKVASFYDNQTDWEDIKKECKDASFFVYSGHGATMGERGKTGGLVLKSNIKGKQIAEELKFRKNTIIIFVSVCRGAGSSAGDNGDIGINEAINRVSDYSNSFFKVGATAYYANNFEGGVLAFLNDFFSGLTISECFERSAKTWTKIEINNPYRFDSSKRISIASKWEPTGTRISYIKGVRIEEPVTAFKNYNIAFVAKRDFSLQDLISKKKK